LSCRVPFGCSVIMSALPAAFFMRANIAVLLPIGDMTMSIGLPVGLSFIERYVESGCAKDIVASVATASAIYNLFINIRIKC